MLRRITLLFLVLNTYLLFPQKHTISGYVGDKRSQEKLIGAVVYDSKTKSAVSTNAYGFFSLTLPDDSVNLIISYIGFAAQRKTFVLSQNLSLNIDLVP